MVSLPGGFGESVAARMAVSWANDAAGAVTSVAWMRSTGCDKCFVI